MAVTNCPHCKADVPPGFDAMPVCMMCGGDLNATPAGGGWASLDTKADNTRICPACNAEVKSVFVLECPECKASLAPVGEPVADIEKEREKFEQLVMQANTPEPVAPPAPEPVAPPMPEPVAAAPVAPPPEPAAPPTPVAPPEPVKQPETVKQPEPVAAKASKSAPLELPNFVDKPETRPEPTTPSRPEPAPTPAAEAPKEGFFAKLLRALGLKK